VSERLTLSPVARAETPAPAYGGQPRQPQLEVAAILANAWIGIAFTRNRRFFLCNPKFAEMFGWTVADLVDQSGEIVYPSRESYEALGQIAVPLLASGGQLDLEWEMRRRDGSTFPCRLIAKAIDPARPALGTVWIADDLGVGRREAEMLSRLAQEREALKIEVAAARGAAAQAEERIGRLEVELAALREADRAAAAGRGVVLQSTIERLRAELAARGEAEERAIAARTAELEATNRRLEAEIAERVQAEGRAQHLADHDALTGLPNRRLLEDRLGQALVFGSRNRKLSAAMFVDLDRFKHVNDTHGHAVGDEMLKEVARRLEEQLREGDTICRLGGDEFVIVLPEVKRSSDAAHVAQKIIDAVAQPVAVDARDLHITCSVGISVAPDDGRDAETLIRNADAAMYHAKEIGRANYQFFTEQMNIAATRRLALENDLRRSVENGELRLLHQPVLDLRTGAVAGYEALLRWQHPARGLVAPGEFIQLAEDTGLILRLGEWVLREACGWARAQAGEPALPIAVNLSARQFGDPKLLEIVSQALAESDLAPHLLELEIAEAAVMQYPDVTLPTLRKLKELGVTLAIDDFGTGQSSFTYLRRLPVDKLKIDVSFVADLAQHKDNEAIIVTIIGLAHALGRKVVAEGVESGAQIEFLRGVDCDYAQGYFIGEPVEGAAAGGTGA
jgi:diguanylate cyclase (GGDEF)-like protein/PAS domain S-box-containing protein